MPGAKWAAQVVGQAFDPNARTLALRVHLGGGRREYELDARLPAELEVAFEDARVLCEVFVRSELSRVHEDRDGDGVRAPSRFGDEGEMARVQSAHRGHEAEPPSSSANGIARRAKFRRRPLDAQHRSLGRAHGSSLAGP
jgi:hypothetical protein